MGRSAGYGSDYAAPGYDRGAYSTYQPPPVAPRPLFDATPQYQQRRGRTGYFNEARNQHSYGPPKMQQRPEKRKREQPKPRQQNRPSPQKQGNRNQADKPKNGNNNGNKEDEDPEEKKQRIDSRFLFEKTNNVSELFEKCNNLGN